MWVQVKLPATGYWNKEVLNPWNPNLIPSIRGLFCGHEARIQVNELFIPVWTKKQTNKQTYIFCTHLHYITHGLYMYYPIFEIHFFVFKEFFWENSALTYIWAFEIKIAGYDFSVCNSSGIISSWKYIVALLVSIRLELFFLH